MGARRAILYARVSGDDRVNESRNLRGQLDLCRNHARSKGWNVIAEFAEDDRRASGARLDLPKLNEMLELARRGEFDVLVVREMDRLARSLPKQLYVEEVLARAGIDIDYVLGAFPDTHEGNFLKNVRAAVAELERLKARERSERGKLQAVRSGSTLVFNRPLWLRCGSKQRQICAAHSRR
jgi:DNA invertase Pin-like site-specific DNA recombinase